MTVSIDYNNVFSFSVLELDIFNFVPMKKVLLFLLVSSMLSGCESDVQVNRNPFVPYIPFSLTLNLNLPTFSNLNSNINPMYINDVNAGLNGIFVMKISNTDFRAWEATCPNQAVSACSRMTLSGLNAKCPCDGKDYSLFTGVGPANFPLIAYRVEVLSNNTIRISN